MWELWVRVPPGAQIGYAEIRGENMPQGALVPNATISDHHTSVAQLAELAALNREVVGSTPTGGTYFMGEELGWS